LETPRQVDNIENEDGEAEEAHHNVDKERSDFEYLDDNMAENDEEEVDGGYDEGAKQQRQSHLGIVHLVLRQ